MRTPRDWSGEELIKRLRKVGYIATCQSGSHVRLTRSTERGDHHISVPLHTPLRLGTLQSILNDIAVHLRLSRDELLKRLQS
jgi:predicted RNA binding protein YcfA (HicA-like mRNA interferase family)